MLCGLLPWALAARLDQALPTHLALLGDRPATTGRGAGAPGRLPTSAFRSDHRTPAR
jgi:hypothetical protein